MIAYARPRQSGGWGRLAGAAEGRVRVVEARAHGPRVQRACKAPRWRERPTITAPGAEGADLERAAEIDAGRRRIAAFEASPASNQTACTSTAGLISSRQRTSNGAAAPINAGAANSQRTPLRGVRGVLEFGRASGMATPWVFPQGVAVADALPLFSIAHSAPSTGHCRQQFSRLIRTEHFRQPLRGSASWAGRERFNGLPSKPENQITIRSTSSSET